MDRIKGLKSLKAKLKDLGGINREIDAIAEGNATEIALDAKNRAPKNFGQLAQSIIVIKDGEGRYTVQVGVDYGGYVEFGTGAKVQVPGEFAEMARRLQGQQGGSFDEGLQSIREWCRAKGIPESAAYPIFISILNKGINPQPYLYPAFVKGRLRFLQGVEKLIKNKVK